MAVVQIFSTQTLMGMFVINADESIFKISYETLGCVYRLQNSRYPAFGMNHLNPSDAIRAVAEHQTGLEDWDSSNEIVSDYAGDWVREDNKLFRMKMLSAFIDTRPKASLREIVDYFEYRHSYFLDRFQIRELFEELIMNGALTNLPSMHLAPEELRKLDVFAENWLRPT